VVFYGNGGVWLIVFMVFDLNDLFLVLLDEEFDLVVYVGL